jgi:hypothetical protein
MDKCEITVDQQDDANGRQRDHSDAVKSGNQFEGSKGGGRFASVERQTHPGYLALKAPPLELGLPLGIRQDHAVIRGLRARLVGEITVSGPDLEDTTIFFLSKSH